MAKIKKIKAREILDSRGLPTVEVDLVLEDGSSGRAAVPSGASTGAHEAVELRDGDKKRFLGKGVRRAVEGVTSEINSRVLNREFSLQSELDQALIELDGSPNKSRLGANALLGVSLAFARAQANSVRKPLYRFLHKGGGFRLPVPLMNVINGGQHADNGLDVQEYMLVPICGERFSEALRAGSEIFHTLKSMLKKRGLVVAVGDEGGFAPRLEGNEQALSLLTEAIESAGYKPGKDVFLALDVAATELFDGEKYTWEKQKLSALELGKIYEKWMGRYPLLSIEDGFSEDDWDGWIEFNKHTKIQLVGDDLFVTNPKRLKEGIERKAANAILVKVNQIGTLTETREAVELAQKSHFRTVISHRSGETEDVVIADLAVGLDCHQIKTGSLCRSERTAKYNQLLRIEEELGAEVRYWGPEAFAT